jgi:hypothetical protein
MASPVRKEEILADLERRLEAASQAVELQLQGEREAVSAIEEREALYWCAFSEMEKPFLDRSDVGNSKRQLIYLAPNDDKLNMSSSEDSTLLPLELFPRVSQKPILGEIKLEQYTTNGYKRQNRTAHARKLREIMEEIKTSIGRRVSFSSN